MAETPLQNYEALSQTEAFKSLQHGEQIFCKGYSNFLKALIENITTFDHANKIDIYHIGESHCLSYAYSQVFIEGKSYVIKPKINFGAKAFHFSTKPSNKYKTMTENHLKKSFHAALKYLFQ